MSGPAQFFETHCHLDYLKAQETSALVQAASESGVEKIITISVSPDNLDGVIDISRNFAQVYCSQGVHPHDAKEYSALVGEKIRANIERHPKVVAIGEIGLDYHYDKSPRDIQREVFEQQLQLSIDLDLPAIIHTRDADSDTQDILRNFAPKMKKKGVIHSFTSSLALAEFCLQEGFSIGFNGIITFKNAENVRDVLRATPKEKILFETDAPFLTPVPHRGKENGPHYLPFVAAKICEVKNLESGELYPLVFKNSLKLFNLN